MDLRWTADEDEFRREARDWLVEHRDQWLETCGGQPASGDTREGFAQHLEWERLLHAGRWAAVSWPAEYGGRAASLWEWLIFEEEYYRAECPQRVTQNGIFLLAPTVFEFGTPAQQNHVLPRLASAEDLWCQGWSEPNAGSDLASLTCRAERTNGGWILNGQKTWTTRGAFCTHLFGLFRTDPDQQRHRGLSYLMVPLDAEGITVRGFGRLDGDEGFAEVFFDDAFVPDDVIPGGIVLGEVDNGWAVAMATTGSERGLTLRSPGRFTSAVDRLIDLATSVKADAPGNCVDDGIADVWIRAEAYRLFTLQTVTQLASGGSVGAESSINKIWWSELDVDIHDRALDLLGANAELEHQWSKAFQFALSGPIYAGTNEIQRNIAAERLLGLPRK